MEHVNNLSGKLIGLNIRLFNVEIVFKIKINCDIITSKKLKTGDVI